MRPGALSCRMMATVSLLTAAIRPLGQPTRQGCDESCLQPPPAPPAPAAAPAAPAPPFVSWHRIAFIAGNARPTPSRRTAGIAAGRWHSCARCCLSCKQWSGNWGLRHCAVYALHVYAELAVAQLVPVLCPLSASCSSPVDAASGIACISFAGVRLASRRGCPTPSVVPVVRVCGACCHAALLLPSIMCCWHQASTLSMPQIVPRILVVVFLHTASLFGAVCELHAECFCACCPGVWLRPPGRSPCCAGCGCSCKQDRTRSCKQDAQPVLVGPPNRAAGLTFVCVCP